MTYARGALPWLAVAVGAVLGTSMRYGLDLLLPHGLEAVPWSTILANTLGSFLLGLLAAGTWAIIPPWLRAGLGAGVLASFTTFSSLMIATVAIAQGDPLAGRPGSLAQAAMVLVGSTLAGLAAALIGMVLGRRLAGRRPGARPTVDDEEDA